MTENRKFSIYCKAFIFLFSVICPLSSALCDDDIKEKTEIVEDADPPGKWVGNVAVATDYLQRGISQTDHHPALQGLIEYDLKTGIEDTTFYASVWASNVDFNDGQSFMEVDNSFGLRGKLDDLSWDIGGIYYLYPGVSSSLDYNYWEIPLQLTYPVTDITSLNLQYFYSPNYSGGAGYGHYVNGAVEVKPDWPIEWAELAIDAMAGYQWVQNFELAGFRNYANWNVGPTLKIDPLSFNLIYSGTTLKQEDCFENENWCGDTVVFTVTAGF